MNRKALVLGGLLALQPALAQAALYVLIDGIPGSVIVASHLNWHEAIGVSWSYEKSNTAQPFRLQATLAQRTASFATIKQAAFNGASIKRIVFDQVRTVSSSQSVVVARLTCESAVISALAYSAQSDDLPMAQLQLGCAKLSWEDFDYSQNGALLRSVKGEAAIPTKAP
jgi:type VI protein secretion system component Hcp